LETIAPIALPEERHSSEESAGVRASLTNRRRSYKSHLIIEDTRVTQT
jgi:hypothetical protein